MMRSKPRGHWLGRHHRQHGQALVELAVFGSLALLALSFMIQIGLQVNYQQEIDQQTFRQAMDIMDSADKIEPINTSVRQFRDRQVPDPTDRFGMLSRTVSQAAATVQWGTYLLFTDDDDRQSQPRTMIQVNDTLQEFRREDFNDDDNPFISRITRQVNARGSVNQNSGSTSSNSSSTTTSAITLKNGSTVSGTVTSSAGFSF